MDLNFTSTEAMLDGIVKDMYQSNLLIDKLVDLGYCYTFELMGCQLLCRETKERFTPRDLVVDEIYRFDQHRAGISGYFLYTLTTRRNGLKGLFTLCAVSTPRP